MGRKYKEKQLAATAGRRRPMIQLEGIGRRQDSSAVGTLPVKPSRVTAIGLLEAYQEDSADSEEEQNQFIRNEDTKGDTTQKEEKEQPDNLDDQLAGFLAEINALDPEKDKETEEKKKETTTQSTEEMYDPENFDPATQWHLLPEPWQACYDAESGYYYYWRTDNDVVQWMPPSASPSRLKGPSGDIVNIADTSKESEGVVCDPSPPDGPVKMEEESGLEDRKNDPPLSVGNINNAEETKVEDKEFKKDEREVIEQKVSLVSYGLGDLDSDESSEEETTSKSPVNEVKPDVEENVADEKVEESTRLEKEDDPITSLHEEEESEDTDEDIARKYNLDFMDEDGDDSHIENRANKKEEDCTVDMYKEEGKMDAKEGSRTSDALRKVVKLSEKTHHKNNRKRTKTHSDSKKARKAKREKEKSVRPERGKFEVDMFAEESLSEGEIKSDAETPRQPYEGLSPVSDLGSIDSSTSGSSDSNSESSESDSEKNEMEIEESKMEYEDISSDSDSRDTVPDSNGSRDVRPKVLVQRETKKKMPSEGGGRKWSSDDDMQDFVDKLLEGALDSDEEEESLTTIQKDRKNSFNEEKTKDLTVAPEPKNNHSEEEKEDDNDDDDNDNDGPLLKAEVFEHLKKGEEKQNTFEKDKKKVMEIETLPSVESEDSKATISEISSNLLEKLGFLEINRKGLTNFQIMLIEIETRIRDWREGALNGQYLITKLELANEEIFKYEETAAPKGWTCHWDSNYKMYYYYNTETEESSWHYPETTAPLPNDTMLTISSEKPPLPPEPEPSQPTTDSFIGPQLRPELPPLPLEEPPESVVFGNAPPPPDELMTEKPQEPMPTEKKAVLGPHLSSAAAVTAANITDAPLSKGSKRESETKKVIMDPYRARLLKKKHVHSDAVLKRTDSEEKDDETQPPPPPGEEDMPPSPWEEPRARSPLAPGVAAQASPVRLYPGRSSPTPASMKSDASCSNNPGSTEAITLSVYDSNVRKKNATDVNDFQITKSEVPNLPTKLSKEKKEKKRKVAKTSGLPIKKRKHVSTLVQKWQQVKQKVEEEMAEESSEEEDPEIVNERKILEWKAQQQLTGKSAYNPNFEEIKGDWRDRVRKAKEKRMQDAPS